MNRARDDGRKAFAGLLDELDGEVQAEQFAGLDPEHQKLELIAREILKLERDLTVPGAAVSDNARIERLSKFITEANF